MSRAKGKTQPTDRADALRRLRDAREFHEAGVSLRDTAPKPAISLFVQAGIAASDALCGLALGEYWRGDAHLGATRLLSETGEDGKSAARALRTLLGFKDGVQYTSASFNTAEVLRAERCSAAILTSAERRAGR